jgi:hypothetical protein
LGGEAIDNIRNLMASIAMSLVVPISLGAQEAGKITGRVLDAADKPVVEADVATFWGGDTGTMQPFNGVKTDKEGKFSMPLQSPFAQSVLAMDKDRKNGGMVVVGGQSLKPIEIKLGPLVKVHGDFFCKETNKKPTWTNLFITVAPHIRVAQCSSTKAEFSFLLPPGGYHFRGYGSDVQSVDREVALSVDTPDLDLKTIDMEATIIARHVGKTPPAWHVTDARGPKKDVKLSDFKGKWVLVEFWGFW